MDIGARLDFLTIYKLLQILDYRHDEGIQRTAIATQGILSAAQVDNDRMRDIARATQRDSQTMKVLTFIAILYLPGTLVSVRTSCRRVHLAMTVNFWFGFSLFLVQVLSMNLMEIKLEHKERDK